MEKMRWRQIYNLDNHEKYFLNIKYLFQEKIRAEFSKMDTDKSGYITKGKLNQAATIFTASKTKIS